MIKQRLGCISPLALISALLTFLVLGLSGAVNGSSMFSPGALNAQAGDPLKGVTSHAGTRKDCAACHPAPWSADTMADRCQACHTSIQTEIADSSSLHGTLAAQDRTLSCSKCHREHQGPAAALTQFDPREFEHALFGYSLVGHSLREDGAPFACSDCHYSSLTDFSPQSCGDCHRQMEPDLMADHFALAGDNCTACHDGLDRYSQFDHGQTAFALVGVHQQVACQDCHPAPRTMSDFKHGDTDCFACHQKDDPHNAEFGPDCALCHTAEGWSPANFDHNLAAFKLEGKHLEVDCEQCHTNGYTGTPVDCFSCHEKDDKHLGAFGRQCETCHNASGWEDATFDHSLSAFPLDGAHIQAACADCHQNQIYKGTPSDCQACHADPAFHLGLFAGQECSACHTTTAWRPARYDEPHTFPMNHGESGNTCADCHQPNLTQWTCFPCHDQNEITREHEDEGISNFSDCLRCHPTGDEGEGEGEGGGEGGGDD